MLTGQKKTEKKIYRVAVQLKIQIKKVKFLKCPVLLLRTAFELKASLLYYDLNSTLEIRVYFWFGVCQSA